MLNPVRLFQRFFPWLLALSRAALGPGLVLCQVHGWSGPVLAALVAAGLLSDIFDGVLARRWKTDTDALRLFDSMGDIVFYLGTAVAFALQCPDLWDVFRPFVFAMIGLEALRLLVDFLRFRKPSSYHAFLSKLTGLLLSLGVIAALAWSDVSDAWLAVAGSTLVVGVLVGMCSQIEGLFMSLVLPVWRRDVRNIAAAFRIRNELKLSAQPMVQPVAQPQ